MMTLKKFLKYFDTMCEVTIIDFTDDIDGDGGLILFEGHTFDKGAKKKLKELYKENYVLDRDEDGDAVISFPYVNKCGVVRPCVHIHIRRGVRNDKRRSKD